MKEHIDTAAAQAASAAASAATGNPGLRMTLGGSATAIGSGSAHWLTNLSDIITIAGVLMGIAATVYGLWRQHQDHKRKERLEARQIALYEARMRLLERGIDPDTAPGELEG